MRVRPAARGFAQALRRVVGEPRPRRISMQASTAMVRRSTLGVPKAGARLVRKSPARGAL
ncbi:hypothetical protein BZM26_18855 [Paraburkholderia strydomiana]|nr:hypothetical protein BZM26_18855 [Paraburkholderia strydomiana]